MHKSNFFKMLIKSIGKSFVQLAVLSLNLSHKKTHSKISELIKKDQALIETQK